MIKVVAFVRRRADVPHEEFVRLWTSEHPLLSRRLGMTPYRINICAAAAEGGGRPPYDGTAEMYWPDVESFRRALASPEGVAAGEDVDRFAESVELVVVDEHVVA